MAQVKSNGLKHVAVICRGLDSKGAVANVALRHAEELCKHFDVTVISDGFRDWTSSCGTTYVLEPARFDSLRRFAHVPNEISFALSAKKALRSIHRRHALDLIICHAHSTATLSARPMRDDPGIPFALVTHGDIFDRPKGTYDAALTWFYRQVTPAAYRDAALVVALSPHMSRLAVRGGAKPACVQLVPNGIDPMEIGLQHGDPQTQTQSSKLEILYVGRLSIEKGIDVLVKAVALLKKRGIAHHLRVAGSGPQLEPLRDQVTALGVGDCVTFLGAIPRPELGLLYRSASVVCVPSRSDPLPSVVLEAMCAGVAVVGADCGGIPFMVTHGITGLVCPPESPDRLADALQEIANDPIRAGEMGEAGRVRATTEFSWSTTGASLAAAIGNAIKREMETAPER